MNQTNKRPMWLLFFVLNDQFDFFAICSLENLLCGSVEPMVFFTIDTHTHPHKHLYMWDGEVLLIGFLTIEQAT